MTSASQILTHYKATKEIEIDSKTGANHRQKRTLRGYPDHRQITLATGFAGNTSPIEDQLSNRSSRFKAARSERDREIMASLARAFNRLFSVSQ
jgi:hypothetical protein